MRVLDKDFNEITEYDLTTGMLVPRTIRQEDGTRERVQIYLPRPAYGSAVAKAKLQISKLKKTLAETDYKIVKCYEYQLVGLDLPYDTVALHEERQTIRDKINQLEASE